MRVGAVMVMTRVGAPTPVAIGRLADCERGRDEHKQLERDRAILCRSLDGERSDPTRMRIPSCLLEESEHPMDCAMRALVEELDIDDPDEELSFLSSLPPMRLFCPNGESYVVDVYASRLP